MSTTIIDVLGDDETIEIKDIDDPEEVIDLEQFPYKEPQLQIVTYLTWTSGVCDVESF